MGYYLLMYVVAFVVFFVIDILWLGVAARKFYRQQLGRFMKTNVNWTAAIVFYALFIGGVLFFVLDPALQRDSWTYALGVGALFGLMTYGTYDLTNLATLKDWPWLVTLVDLVWGSFLAASTATISFFIMQRIGG